MPSRPKPRQVALEPATAPRTVAGYAETSPFQIRLLLSKLGAFSTPEAEERFRALTTHEERVDLLLAMLVEWDVQQERKKKGQCPK